MESVDSGLDLNFLCFEWAASLNDIVQGAHEIMKTDGFLKDDSGSDIHLNLKIAHGLDEIYDVLNNGSGIFLFPFQYPIDAHEPGNIEKIRRYDLILDSLANKKTMSRKAVIGICGSVKHGRFRRMDQFPTRGWADYCVYNWILPPVDPWNIVLAVEQIIYHDVVTKIMY